MTEPPAREPDATSEPDVRTFLIADVRGYTAYTNEHGDEAGARLATAFAQIVEEVVTRAGGRLVELRGDEALVVFASPRSAIRAAVALQHRFVEQLRAPDGLPLRVGIGLDAGEAVPVGAGYRGGALNLAARLCSIAGAGEVLVSEGLAHLARRVDGLAYEDRGRVQVKGIAEPVRVLRVAFPLDMPSAPAARRSRPRLLVPGTIAVIVLLATAVVLFATALGGSDPPARIDENALAEIDADRASLASQTPVGDGPTAVAAGLGSLWVASATDHTIWRITPGRGDRPVIPVDGTPGGIAADAKFVWVTDAAGRTVAQINPGSNGVVRDDIAVGNGAGPIAVGEGAVWVGNTLDGTVSRVDPARGVETHVIPVAGRPDAIAAGAGAVWVASGDTASVTRIDPDPDDPSVVGTIAVGNGARGIAVGMGSVWVANADDGTITRIDPDTARVVAVGEVGPGVTSVAASSDAVWAGSPTARRVYRVDPGTLRVTRTIEVGASPSALAAGPGGSVWMTALPPPARHRGGELRLASYLTGCNCFDPAFTFQADTWRLMTIVFDGLVAYRKAAGAAGATVAPDLARSLPQVTDGGRTYRFVLRPGVRFATGATVRASDFRASMERLIGLNALTLPPFYDGIVGARECAAAGAGCDLSRGIETDDRTGAIAIHLTAPDPDLLLKLAMPFAAVLPADAPGPREPVTTPEQFEHLGRDAIAGTGPYRIGSFDAERLVLVRNEHFRVFAPDAQPDGYPDRIVVRVLGDGNGPTEAEAATVRAVADGDLDWATYLHPRDVRRLAISRPAQLRSNAAAVVMYLMLNTALAPFSNVDARRALAYAIDRHRVVGFFGGDLMARPTCQILPPAFVGYRPYCPYNAARPSAGVWTGADLARARDLVRESGTRGSRVTIAAPAGDPVRGPVAAHVVDVLRAIGYRATVRTVDDDFGAIADPRSDVAAAVIGWAADFAAASNFVEPMFTCATVGVENVTRFCDRRTERLIRAARRADDPAAAGNAWAAVDRALVDASPAIPLVAMRHIDLVSDRVGNYVYNPQFGVVLSQLWVR